jgi:hypothetical protein
VPIAGAKERLVLALLALLVLRLTRVEGHHVGAGDSSTGINTLRPAEPPPRRYAATAKATKAATARKWAIMAAWGWVEVMVAINARLSKQ